MFEKSSIGHRTYSQSMAWAEGYLEHAARHGWQELPQSQMESCRDAVREYFHAATMRVPDDCGAAVKGIRETLNMIDNIQRQTNFARGGKVGDFSSIDEKFSKTRAYAKATLGLMYVTGASVEQNLAEAKKLFQEAAHDIGRDNLVARGLIADNWFARGVGVAAHAIDFLSQAAWEVTHRGCKKENPALVNSEEVRVLKAIGHELRAATKSGMDIILGCKDSFRVGPSYNILARLYPRTQNG